MGDILGLLQHLNLSPVNTVVLAILAWFIGRLHRRLDALEGPTGALSEIREEINDNAILVARIDERVKAIEDHHE